MSKWKLQAVEPDTCDPPGCRYIELWDVEAEPLLRTHTVVAFDRQCAAHETDTPKDKMLWADGNWKPKKEYIQYQRTWFRRQNHLKWLVEHPDESMPPQIASLTSDPVTTGSTSKPSQPEIDGLNRAYGWNQTDNQRKNSAAALIQVELGAKDREGISWSFTGKGGSRALTITAPALNAEQQGRVQAAADIQFGPGKVAVGN